MSDYVFKHNDTTLVIDLLTFSKSAIITIETNKIADYQELSFEIKNGELSQIIENIIPMMNKEQLKRIKRIVNNV